MLYRRATSPRRGTYGPPHDTLCNPTPLPVFVTRPSIGTRADILLTTVDIRSGGHSCFLYMASQHKQQCQSQASEYTLRTARRIHLPMVTAQPHWLLSAPILLQIWATHTPLHQERRRQTTNRDPLSHHRYNNPTTDLTTGLSLHTPSRRTIRSQTRLLPWRLAVQSLTLGLSCDNTTLFS